MLIKTNFRKIRFRNKILIYMFSKDNNLIPLYREIGLSKTQQLLYLIFNHNHKHRALISLIFLVTSTKTLSFTRFDVLTVVNSLCQCCSSGFWHRIDLEVGTNFRRKILSPSSGTKLQPRRQKSLSFTPFKRTFYLLPLGRISIKQLRISSFWLVSKFASHFV